MLYYSHVVYSDDHGQTWQIGDSVGPDCSEAQVVELSDGQMVEDVRLAVNGARPVAFYGRQGGMVPAPKELLDVLTNSKEEQHAHAAL